MSDSSKETLQENEEFNPETFLRALCDNTNINLPNLVQIEYPVGWIGIVEELIQEIKEFSINITMVSDHHNMLEISFNARKSSGEAEVWRAINSARIQSMSTCVKCGTLTEIKPRFNSGVVICKECNTLQSKTEKTGTWLDRF